MVHITCTVRTFMKCKTTTRLFIGSLNTPNLFYVQETVALMDFNLWWFNTKPKTQLRSMKRTCPEICVQVI